MADHADELKKLRSRLEDKRGVPGGWGLRKQGGPPGIL